MTASFRGIRLAVSAGAALLLSIGSVTVAFADAGDLDTGFGGDGKVRTDFTSGFDAASSVAVQPDGRIVAVGTARFGVHARFALARYNPDGTLDATFGGDGKVTTAFSDRGAGALAVVLQADGKIVAAGVAGIFKPGQDSKMALARYNPDGSLDLTFGGDGKVRTDVSPTFDQANAAAIQADGKIVLAGYADAASSEPLFGLTRYNPDGTLDVTFDGDGKVTTLIRHGAVAFGVAIAADGTIVASGDTLVGHSNIMFGLARYNPDGTLDPTFSGNGKVSTDFTQGSDANNAVAIQADGKIVASGGAGDGSTFALVRYATDGTLDPTFGGDGKVRTNFTRHADFAEEGLVIAADGKILAAGVAGSRGKNPTFAVARYETDGTLDPTFGAGGKVRTDFTRGSDDAIGLAIQPDGKIVAAGNAGEIGEGGGNTTFALARYLAA